MHIIKQWYCDNWRQYEAKQLPIYENKPEVEHYCSIIRNSPAIAQPKEIDQLRSLLVEAERGNSFIIQAGSCAESLTNNGANYPADLVELLQNLAMKIPSQAVIKIARAAGQLAKPRTENYEIRGSMSLPNYAGDMINNIEYNLQARLPNPQRLLAAYEFSSNIYKQLQQLDKSIFISHEALNLEYEEALMRDNYLCSAHTVWIGNVNKYSPAHIEFARGIKNPIGIKLDQYSLPIKVIELANILNPHNEEGKLIFIIRMGSEIIQKLPPLIAAIKAANIRGLWISDPMHGNTVKLPTGYKNRPISAIEKEIMSFAQSAKQQQIYNGGIHLEMSADDILECSEDGIYHYEKYKTLCDPRLNSQQAIAIMRLISQNWQF